MSMLTTTNAAGTGARPDLLSRIALRLLLFASRRATRHLEPPRDLIDEAGEPDDSVTLSLNGSIVGRDANGIYKIWAADVPLSDVDEIEALVLELADAIALARRLNADTRATS